MENAMRNLAVLIRKGVSLVGTVHETDVVIICALAANMSVEEARKLYSDAIREGHNNGPNNEKVLRAMGLNDFLQLGRLRAFNHTFTAEEIANMLETGDMVV